MKILLVDDDLDTRALLKLQLQAFGFDVYSAEDGEDALTKLASVTPDIIVTDILMPNLDGYGLCKAVKSDQAFRHIPIVFYSAHFLEKEDEELAYKIGVAKYLRKPSDISVLSSAILDIIQFSRYAVDLNVQIEALGNELDSLHQQRLLNQLVKKIEVLKQHERDRIDRDIRFESIFSAVPDPLVVCDSNGIIVEVNANTCSMFGYEEHELLGRSVEILVPDKYKESHVWLRNDLLASKQTLLHKKRSRRFKAKRKDGVLIPVEINVGVSRLGGQTIATAILRDVSDNLEREKALKKSAILFEMLSSCNHCIVRTDNEHELYQNICNTLVNVGKYSAAWVAIAENQGEWEPVSVSGNLDGGLKQYQSLLSNLPYNGRAVDDSAIEGLQYEYIRNRKCITLECDGEFYYLVFLRLLEGTRVFGNLCVVLDQKRQFGDAEEMSLLDEVSMDVSYGVTQLRSNLHKVALQEKNELYHQAIQSSRDGILIVNAYTFKIEFINQSLLNLTGYASEEYLGRDIDAFFTPEIERVGVQDAYYAFSNQVSISIQLKMYRKDKSSFWCEVHISPVYEDGVLAHYVCISNDISQQIAYQEALERKASFDDLTGLPNRNLLRDRLQQAIGHADRYGQLVGFLFLDLDRFKDINDSLGHSKGDQVLQHISNSFQECVRKGDTVARWGGDEFIFIYTELTQKDDLLHKLDQIVQVIEKPFYIDGNKFDCKASIGCTFYPSDGRDFEKLLKNADSAMYVAKSHQSRSYHFYDKELNKYASRKVEVEFGIRDALETGGLEVHYQPQVRIGQNQTVIGYEALARCVRGDMMPSEFIPIAEQTGLITKLGSWVLEAVCMDIAAGHFDEDLTVAVNISLHQLDADKFVSFVEQLVEKYSISPGRLELEVTESVMALGIDKVRAKLTQLKNLGVMLSIDDFGTGYSSLSYLQQLPFDKLKIDRQFVMGVVDSKRDLELCQAIVNMASALDLDVIAEGVETDQQAEILNKLGCNIHQGYLYGKPSRIK